VHDVVVEGDVAIDHAVDAVLSTNEILAPPPQTLGFGGIGSEVPEGARETHRIAGRHEHAAVSREQLADSPDVRGHDRNSERHGLEEAKRKSLTGAVQDTHVERRVERVHVLESPQPAHTLANTRVLRKAFELIAEGTVACADQNRSRLLPAEPDERIEKASVVLLLRQAGCTPDHESVVFNPEPRPSTLSHGGIVRRQRHTIWDDTAFARKAPSILGNLRRYGDHLGEW
jgi:hypothetical protein